MAHARSASSERRTCFMSSVTKRLWRSLQPGKVINTEETVKSIKETEEAVSGTSVSTEELNPKHRESKIIGSCFQVRTVAELAQMQENYPDIITVLRGKLTNTKPSSPGMAVKGPEARHYWILWDSLVLQDGLLCKQFAKKDGTGQYLQFIVPSAMKKEVLYQMQDLLMSGHMGCKKTKEKTLQRFFWYALKENVG